MGNLEGKPVFFGNASKVGRKSTQSVLFPFYNSTMVVLIQGFKKDIESKNICLFPFFWANPLLHLQSQSRFPLRIPLPFFGLP